ncbi:MAG: UMP kinase [Bacteroidales bacterium]|nr:UMP kinase [Bacteroidales bacterium]
MEKNDCYKRVLLKLSGEALMGQQGYGIDGHRLDEYAGQIKEIAELGVKVGIVIGGGNIFRGITGAKSGFDRVKGDYMGMLATVINSLAIQSALESLGVASRVLTAVNMGPVGERYSKDKLEAYLNEGKVAIFGFGTGNPYFTTDTASSLRAIEMQADVLLKGTRVDGVYTADPEKDPSAIKYEEITFDEVYQKGLKVMDLTSFTMCLENNMPIIVFDMNTKGNLKKIILGQKLGTLIKK